MASPRNQTSKTLSTKLRFGWTTGTCATAAVAAAYEAMVTGVFPDEVALKTPSGRVARLAISSTAISGKAFMAGVIKDAGDDPDVTHGAEIRATVAPIAKATTTAKGVVFCRGEGVGEVTRPGLPLPVGAPAINPVPQQMMRATVAMLARELGGTRDVQITISVPGGEALAEKTWNPRLGISGGISILGTTGVVRPFSCAAWIASIQQGIDVALAAGERHIMGATGATSEAAAQAHLGLPLVACIDMGDFVGGMLKYLRRHPPDRVTIAGGMGKMTKLAQGASDLHSGRSQIDFVGLAKLAAKHGLDPQAVTAAQSAMEVMALATQKQRRGLANEVALAARETATKLLGKSTNPIQLQTMIVARDGAILAATGFA